MSRPQRITLLTASVIVVATTLFSAPAHGQSSEGFVPRHERIAASILRRKAASGISVRTEGVTVAQSAPLPGGIAPPPPAVLDVISEPAGLAATPITDPVQSVGSSLMAPAPPASATMDAASASTVFNPGEVITAPYADPFAPAMGGGCDDGCTGCGASGCTSMGSTYGCGAASYGCDGSCGGHCGEDRLWLDSLSVNVGVLGYKNMINRGESGSFGVQQGFNWAAPWVVFGMNSQIGFRATQTDFNGSDFTAEHRAQFFVTGGFYKRNISGWQGGFVFDYLHDDWYTTIDLAQLRGELSWGAGNGSSVGFMFATSVAEDNTTAVLGGASTDESWETHDLMAFFYEVQSNQHRRGTWRMFVGFTGESDGLVGSTMKIPLAGTWSLEPEFTYLVPDEETGFGGHDQESWNVAFNLVWYPGRARRGLELGRRTMLDVAGNGTMIPRLIP